MIEKKRITNHNQRIVSAKHNDRNYDISKDKHINKERVKDNIYISCYTDTKTFDETEAKYYNDRFRKMYDEQMSRHRKKGNTSRIKTFEKWRKTKRYCADETIYYVGNQDNCLDDETFRNIAKDIIIAETEYAKQHNNCYQVLDVSLHFDEATPHLHVRRVWQYQEGDTWYIGQEEALKRSGIALPEPEREEGRCNNRKMTFTREMRERVLDICERRGIDVEREPSQRRKSKQNLTTLQYQIEAQNNVIEENNKKIEDQNRQIEMQRLERERLINECNSLNKKIEDLKQYDKSLSDRVRLQRNVFRELQNDCNNLEEDIMLSIEEKQNRRSEQTEQKERATRSRAARSDTFNYSDLNSSKSHDQTESHVKY